MAPNGEYKIPAQIFMGQKEGRRNFILTPCQTPGCSVMIRTQLGRQDEYPFCRWCETGKAYNVRKNAEAA